MFKNRFEFQTGFSLLEALLAFMLVGFGLLGLARLQNDFFKSNANTRVYTAAFNFAQQKLEQFRSFATQNDFDNLLNLHTDTDDICDPGAANSPCQGINATLIRSWEMSDCSPGLSCRWVNIRVAWTDMDGTDQKIALNSYLAGFEPITSGVLLETQ